MYVYNKLKYREYNLECVKEKINLYVVNQILNFEKCEKICCIDVYREEFI